jgi:micrococcal nuclease
LRRSTTLSINRLIFLILIVGLLILSIIIKRQWETPTHPVPGKAGTTRIIDGDTFEDAGGRKVRLLALDTPEKGEPYYGEAKDELRRLLDGHRLKFESGPETNDRYGRLLAFVFADDSIFVNEKLLEEGFARAYFFEANMAASPYAKRLCQAQQTALHQKRGIWSLPEPKPESRYFGNPHTLRFHRPGCNSVEHADTNQLVRAISRDVFLEQCYSPCRNCKP